MLSMNEFARCGFGVMAITTAIVCYTDFRYRQIPNWIPVSVFALGISFQCMFNGFRGLRNGFMGFLLSFCFFLILYLLSSVGGGDVKLAGALGVWMNGWPSAIQMLFILAAVGGIMAIAYILIRLIWRKRPIVAGTMAYGPAICISAILAFLASQVQ